MPRAMQFTLVAIITLITAAIYLPGLTGGFFFDDFANIVEAPSLHITEISLNSLTNVWNSGIAGPLGRPVSLLSFAANHYFTSLDPFYLKLTNIVIHCINSALVYLVSTLIFKSIAPTWSSKKNITLSAATALIWAVHPIQLTSVLYVVQRMTSLSSLFMLAGIAAYIAGRQATHRSLKVQATLLGSCFLIFLPLALLSKETGILLLVYVAAYEIFGHKSRNEFDRNYRYFFKILLLVALTLIALILLKNNSFTGGYDSRPFTLHERILTETRVIWIYISQILAPTLSSFNLYHDDITLSTSLSSPISTTYSIIGISLLLSFTLYFRNQAPALSLAIAWFLGGHLLESTVVPLEIMHEHRNYLPSLGLAILFIYSIDTFTSKNGIKHVVTSGIIATIAGYLALTTYLRADMYSDPFRRTQLEVAYKPGSIRAQYEAGALLVEMYNQTRADFLRSMAEHHLHKVSELDPSYKLNIIGLIQLSCIDNPDPPADLFNELKHRIRHSRWDKLDRTVMHAIASMSKERNICLNRDQIEQLFNAALSNSTIHLSDKSVVLSDYVFYLWIGQHDHQAAYDLLKYAVTINKNDTINRLNLLQLSSLAEDWDTADKMRDDLRSRKLPPEQEKTLFRIEQSLDIK